VKKKAIPIDEASLVEGRTGARTSTKKKNTSIVRAFKQFGIRDYGFGIPPSGKSSKFGIMNSEFGISEWWKVVESGGNSGGKEEAQRMSVRWASVVWITVGAIQV